MQDRVTLPQWLDNLIFEKLGAKYCRSNADMTVIDWDKNDVLNYLGTYFPRSYAESYCLFSEFFKNHLEQFVNKAELSIFDFGCGTGGEIIGFLTVLDEQLPNLKKVRIVALDGNQDALLLYEEIIAAYQRRTRIQIDSIPAHLHIDFYKLEVLDGIMCEYFDIIISFKAICEFLTKRQFEERNAYEHLVRFLLSKLDLNGFLLLEDVTTFNDTTDEWLPKTMDRGLSAIPCRVVAKNKGYNQSYYITHSHKQNDISKVAWRIIKR